MNFIFVHCSLEDSICVSISDLLSLTCLFCKVVGIYREIIVIFPTASVLKILGNIFYFVSPIVVRGTEIP